MWPEGGLPIPDDGGGPPAASAVHARQRKASSGVERGAAHVEPKEGTPPAECTQPPGDGCDGNPLVLAPGTG
eukprot:5052573-Prymnesium_polylepis.1